MWQRDGFRRVKDEFNQVSKEVCTSVPLAESPLSCYQSVYQSVNESCILSIEQVLEGGCRQHWGLEGRGLLLWDPVSCCLLAQGLIFSLKSCGDFRLRNRWRFWVPSTGSGIFRRSPRISLHDGLEPVPTRWRGPGRLGQPSLSHLCASTAPCL